MVADVVLKNQNISYNNTWRHFSDTQYVSQYSADRMATLWNTVNSYTKIMYEPMLR